MINIENKEPEVCSLMVVDMNGSVCYETHLEPFDKLTLDISALLRGIYTLVFKTTHTRFAQQIVKY